MSTERSVLNDRRSRGVTFVIAVAVVGLATFILGRMTAPDAAVPAQGPSPIVTLDHGSPASDDPGIATASRSGAAAAATDFARSMGSVRAYDEDYVEEMEALAAPSWRAEARRLAQNGLDFVRDSYGPRGEISFVPIRYRVSSFSLEQATVHVWGAVLSSGAADGIDNTWGISTIELVRIDDAWRARRGTSEPGPTPALQASPDSAPISALRGFTEYRSGPQP